MILVCFAMEDEAKPFRVWARKQSELAVLISGVGADNAERHLRAWLAQHERPEALLTCGFAGGLNPRWQLGAVLYEADPAFPWVEQLRQAGACPARFHQTPKILASAAEKNACYRATGCEAVEMESAALRAVCASQQIPSATCRVISDPAEVDMPLDFNAFMTPQQTLSYGRLLSHLAIHPRLLPRLLEFHRQTLLASRRLAEVLARVLG
jgi:adenosylhomocysteine nucleosidase